MLYSHFFGKCQRSVSSQFEAKNHELLIKGGFIDQLSSGIYTLLPLGKKVLSKIENIIREELNQTGAMEVQMPLLQPKINWEKTKRWDSVDVLFKTTSRYGAEYGIAPTHEEIVTPLVKKFINSYKDLPLALYHITTKFRDEPRPKSGILRGREFGMKDLYSFHADKKDFDLYYQKITYTYLKIFKRMGFEKVKITEASGGDFTKKHSHEFNIITPAGEVDLIYCQSCTFAQNTEVSSLKKNDSCPKCKVGKILSDRAIEIGNIFDLGTRFSESFDLTYQDKNGKNHQMLMGCYGIGITRIIGALVEAFHDEKGIIWPASVAPFQIHLIGLNLDDEKVKKQAHTIYKLLTAHYPLEVLFDDREDVMPGEKFATADLIGIPHRLIVSKKTGEKIEYKKRSEKESKLINIQELTI